MLSRKEMKEQTTEPIQPKHIKQDMHKVRMHKHISKQAPRLNQETGYRSRQFKILQNKTTIPVKQNQKHRKQSSKNKNSYINIYILKMYITSSKCLF